MNKTKIEPCCLTCKHFDICPIITEWVKLTELPIEAATFHCSEYKFVELRQEFPCV